MSTSFRISHTRWSGLRIIYSLCIHISYQHDLKNNKRDREVHEFAWMFILKVPKLISLMPLLIDPTEVLFIFNSTFWSTDK